MVGCTKAKDTQESSLLADTELEDSTDTTDSTVDKEQGTDTPTVTPPEGEAIAYSQSSDTVKPTTPAIKKSKAE